MRNGNVIKAVHLLHDASLLRCGSHPLLLMPKDFCLCHRKELCKERFVLWQQRQRCEQKPSGYRNRKEKGEPRRLTLQKGDFSGTKQGGELLGAYDKLETREKETNAELFWTRGCMGVWGHLSDRQL